MYFFSLYGSLQGHSEGPESAAEHSLKKHQTRSQGPSLALRRYD